MATSSVGSTTASTTSTTSTAASVAGSATAIAAANRASAQKILTSMSAGSGVDLASLAQNLVDAEKIPKQTEINAKITKNESKVSGLSAVMFMMSELKASLSGLKDKNNFNTVNVTNSNTSAVSVTASAAAAVDDHSVVINSLSKGQKWVSAGFVSGTDSINNGSAFKLNLTGTNAGVSEGTSSRTSTYIATISSPTFGTNPSVTDFKTFSIDVNGQTISLTPAPATATMADLASNIQSQLRTLDGSSDLSVTLMGASGLQITSATTSRVLTNPVLSKSTVINLETGASIGTATDNTIQNASFGSNPSANDFSSFTVNISGTERTIFPAPTSPTLSSLAENIQSQLRALDANSDITVSYSGSSFTVSSASNKTITGIGLTKKTYSDTPADLVSAINSTYRGFKAELINTGMGSSPYQVRITGSSGSTEGFTLSTDSAAANTLLSVSNAPVVAATDANITVDGVSYKRKNNSISDIVTGLTFNLKAPASSVTLSVARDTTDLKTKLNALVTAYNDFDNICKETTNPKSTLDQYGATLVGDSTVRMVKQQIRSLLSSTSSTPGSSIKSMNQVGFSINEKGVMSLDATKLDTVLQTNIDDVAKVFTGGYNSLSTYSSLSAGVAGDTVKKLTTLLGPTGPFTTKTENANTENTKYQADLTKLQTRMDALLVRYQKQFSAMNSIVGSTNSLKTSLKSTFDGMMASYTNK
ncbi:MAG: flagellar filament capping protein FliD [Burkholderiaceae bacterium]